MPTAVAVEAAAMRCRTAAASDRQQLAHRRQQRRCPTAMQAQQPHSDALQPAVTQQPSSGSSTNTSSSGSQQLLPLPRRALLAVAASTAAAAATAAGPAAASKLPEAFDKAWEGIGGGPADLVFPEDFLGVWDVESVLTGVELPLGPEFVPDMRVVQRAQQQDLDKRVFYQVAFLQNQRGEVVPDRSFNTASLMQTYLGEAAEEVQRRVEWNPNDPNMLQMVLPNGLQISTRVTRRSEEWQGDDRLSTSEFFQQLITTQQSPEPKVKASQCFTKYKWRSAETAAAGGGSGVQVVATQVVSDYLTASDGAALMMQAGNKPVVVYTYRMAFRRPQTAAAASAQEAAAAALEGVPQ